jgi:hypothetical protein
MRHGTIKIGKASVDNLGTPAEKDAFHWDESLKGFGVKVTPSGRKMYVVQYRTNGTAAPARRYTIGRHGSPWSPAAARSEAERLLLRVATGEDPAIAKQQKRADAADLAFSAYADLKSIPGSPQRAAFVATQFRSWAASRSTQSREGT